MEKTLRFGVEYHTEWGECLQLALSVDGGATRYIACETHDGVLWQASAAVGAAAQTVRWAYRVVDAEGGAVRVEHNSWRLFSLDGRGDIDFRDTWTEDGLSPVFHRTAFSECVMRPGGDGGLRPETLSAPRLLVLDALPPADGRVWAVCGSADELGGWDAACARRMERVGTYEWAIPLGDTCAAEGFEYKYLLVDPQGQRPALWERGDNRRFAPASGAGCTVRVDNNPDLAQPLWRGAGCVVPVFSLRSEGSLGAGDFGDLLQAVRWAASCGLSALQLLPVNDTAKDGTWRDSYPYNGISVFALHPLYLDAREWRDRAAYALVAAEGRELNALPQMDYARAYALKWRFVKSLFAEIGEDVLHSAGYADFCADNEHWLPHYSRFCLFRDRYGTADWRRWPENAAEHGGEADVYRFAQYLLHRQMSRAHEEARRLGVILKGDIPIGVCPDSVPAWRDGRLFHFDGQAGAPPDDFAVRGQNWGFPTYNWEEMERDGYLWWRRRLAHMGRYFDAYRIDHVLGFFRIWEVPQGQVYGVLGHFRPALPYTADEIKSFGFALDPQAFALPRVPEERMAELAARWGADFPRVYFGRDDTGYVLRPEYRSQCALRRVVQDRELCDELCDIAAEVLFVADPDGEGKLHPRVCGRLTHIYKSLPEEAQRAFDRLHDHFFYERHNAFWAEGALRKLPAITGLHDSESAEPQLCPLGDGGMLVCAEDLGMVPAGVKETLERLGILSLEIQRMPKEYGRRFADLSHNPYLSVATVSTHDMPPLRLWWAQDRERAEAFWHEALGHGGDAPDEATPAVCEEIVSRHLRCPSMLCLIALQNILALSPDLRDPHPECEQINDPANPDQHWQYRMPVTLETLIHDSGFSEKLRLLVAREN